MRTLLILVAVSFVLIPRLTCAQPPPTPSAILSDSKGPIELQSASGKSKPIGPADNQRLLYQGETLTCKDESAYFVLTDGAFIRKKIVECRQGYMIAAPAGRFAPVLE